ncbi:tetratricopeptide repeat protein [Pontibacter sp. Tf4]|uniref:tetratricopeptide repeat protein n=1 Tax=Pontibacter sp. Tf4 TaxID=2761620 RepID=UPI001623E102|nr:tetratricopeptide repeat protein [Pontibacter sp. Tf4]MBB6610128.1 tetratricopeptide repeat protein [Pontibacter sp. Tf4]
MHHLPYINTRPLRKALCFLSVTVLMLGSSCNPVQQDGEHLVNLEEVTDDEEAKLRNLDAAIQRNGQDASLFARRARVLLSKGELEKALKDVDDAIALNEKNMSYLFLKAHILRAMHQPAEALALALKAERNSYQNTALYVLLSDLYLQLKQPQKAAEVARKALALDPDNGYAFYFKGRAAAATGDTARALTNYRLAVTEEPELLEAQRDLAGALVKQQQLDTARYYLQKVQKQLPKDALVWYYQGMYYQQVQKTDSALWSYQKALALADTLQAAHARAGFLMYAKGDYPAAILHFEKAARDNNHNIKYISALANAYERTGQNINALEQYQRLAALQPGYGVANYSIARLKAKLTRPAPVVSQPDTTTITE